MSASSSIFTTVGLEVSEFVYRIFAYRMIRVAPGVLLAPTVTKALFPYWV